MSDRERNSSWQNADIFEREKASAAFFHTLPGVGSRTLQKLQEGLGSLAPVFELSEAELKPYIRSGKAREKLMALQHEQEAAWQYYQSLKKQQMGILLQNDPEYPESLKQIFDPPFILYYKGDRSVLQRPALAVVGCRESTVYGRTQAAEFSRQLAQAGIVIVSGMARGIDSSAHQGALQAAGGKTIAVLGSGLSVIYPAENKPLAAEITRRGLLLSEFSPSTRPEPGNFPRRNRIISGLSQGVLVVEARKKSGSLITADFALEQGREVYAMPGMVSNVNSEGTHRLIQQGARLVMNAEDILEDYGELLRQETVSVSENRDSAKPQGKTEPVPAEPGKKTKPQRKESEMGARMVSAALSPEEEQLLEVLNDRPQSLDEILLQVQMNPGSVMQMLLQLEIQGKILSLPGNCYIRKE